MKINRCPFCGSSKVNVRFYNQPSVVCGDCLCMGPAASRLTKENKSECEQEAILRWNKRVDYSHTITLANRASELQQKIVGQITDFKCPKCKTPLILHKHCLIFDCECFKEVIPLREDGTALLPTGKVVNARPKNGAF